MTTKIILQGGGDHAKVVVDCLKASGATISGIYDPKYTGNLFGIPQLGVYEPSVHPDALAIIAIGDNGMRKKVVQRTFHAFANAIHPSAIISSFAGMGVGNMVLHGAVLQANSKIGDHVIVNTGAQVDHDCIVGDFVHLAPGSILCGGVSLGEGAFVGAGAVIIPGKKIGNWATIGAGAIVTRDVPDYGVAVGNPARVIRCNSHG